MRLAIKPNLSARNALRLAPDLAHLLPAYWARPASSRRAIPTPLHIAFPWRMLAQKPQALSFGLAS